MSTLRNPVGPQSPSTYWRRRLLVLGGLIAVIVVIVLIVVRPGAAPADPKDSVATDGSSETSDAAASDTDPATDGPAGSVDPSMCAPGVIAIEAVTDKVTYAAGEQPLISMKVTNTGATECDLAVGTDIQTFTITSGAEQYWSSVDCQSAAAPQQVSIAPGEAGAMSTTPIPWDRTRSDPATCATDRPAVPAGGASYHLTVRLGELESETKQMLLY